MRKSNFLLACLLLISSLATAQAVVSYGFETSQNAENGSCGFTGWEHSQNYNVTIGLQDVSKARTGSGCLYANNETHDGAFWGRESVMKKVKVDENTSYRITFWMKGDNSVKEGEERGRFIFNTQIQTATGFPSINAGNGNDFNMWDNMEFNPETWTRKTLMMYYPTDAEMKNIDPGNIRLVWNYYTKGEFILDDISMEKSTIAGICFNKKQVEVDFGYVIDVLSFGDIGAVLPLSSLIVKVNGQTAEIVSAVIPKDKLNITLEDELKPADVVTVSFTNPDSEEKRLYYLEQKHPEWNDTNDEWDVKSFIDEATYYDSNLDFNVIPVEPVDTELVLDSSLEGSYYTNDAQVFVSATGGTDAHSGSKYMKILPNTTANVYDKIAFIASKPIEKGESLTVSFWAKSKGNPTGIGLCLYKNSTEILNDDYSAWKTMTVSGDEWNKYSYTVTASVSAEAPSVCIQGGGIQSEVHVDDVSIITKRLPSSFEVTQKEKMKVFVRDGILFVSSDAGKPKMLEVYSLTGSLVLKRPFDSYTTVETTELTKGMYIVRLYGLTDNSNYIQKIVF